MTCILLHHTKATATAPFTVPVPMPDVPGMIRVPVRVVYLVPGYPVPGTGTGYLYLEYGTRLVPVRVVSSRVWNPPGWGRLTTGPALGDCLVIITSRPGRNPYQVPVQ